MLSGSTVTTSFELAPVRGAAVCDLDRDALEAFVRLRLPPKLLAEHPIEDLATRVGLAVHQGGAVVPTPVGMLLLGHHPQLLNPQWGICAVRISGRVVADPIAARDDIEGTLPTMVERALAFVTSHTESVRDQVHPSTEAREYSLLAVREALVNALVHRDLRHASRVAVHVFDDKLVVRSPGGLPPSLPPPEELDLDGGLSVPRNPILASGARLLGLGEQIGRGLPIIRREVEAATREPAVMVATQHEVRVEIPSALRPSRD